MDVSPGLVVMGVTNVLKVMGSNPSTVYWMDIFHVYLLQKMLCLFDKTKINEKEAGDEPFKKIALHCLDFGIRGLSPIPATFHIYLL